MWDFAELTMQFQFRNQKYNLKGTVPGSMQIVPCGRFSKCMSLASFRPCLMLLTSCNQTVIELNLDSSLPELQKLLADFDDIF